MRQRVKPNEKRHPQLYEYARFLSLCFFRFSPRNAESAERLTEPFPAFRIAGIFTMLCIQG